jgi:hypothetical protein
MKTGQVSFSLISHVINLITYRTVRNVDPDNKV